MAFMAAFFFITFMAFMAAFFFITGGAAFMAFIAAFFFITFMAFMAAFFFITGGAAFMAFMAAFFFITFMAFISAFLACCHCWKRKERDILPHYTLEIPWDPDDPRNYKAKTKIMDEFDLEDEAAERKEEDGGDFD